MNLKKTGRKIATAAIAAAALAVPLTLAPQAHAATSSGCTVTPLTPIYDHHNSEGVKVLDYRISVSCSSNRTVTIYQERWEEDSWPNGDDLVGSSTFVRSFSSAGSTTIHNYRTLVDGEIGYEEMYQRTRFKVTSNGVTSPLTSWQNSGVQAFSN